MEEVIGNEERWAKESLISLKQDGPEVKEITSDPDSSAYRAADSLYIADITYTEPEHFLDTRHCLGEQINKTIYKKKIETT